MTVLELMALRDNPPFGLELIVSKLCEALIAASDGNPLPERHVQRLLRAAETWSWCDPGVISQLVEQLTRVPTRQPEGLLKWL